MRRFLWKTNDLRENSPRKGRPQERPIESGSPLVLMHVYENPITWETFSRKHCWIFKTTSGCYIVAITIESFLVGIILSGQPRAGRALFNSCYQIKAVTGLLPGAVACPFPKTGCVIEVRLWVVFAHVRNSFVKIYNDVISSAMCPCHVSASEHNKKAFTHFLTCIRVTVV